MNSAVRRFLAATRCSILSRRNLGLSWVAYQKASDPIQQLFLDKLREYRNKSSGGKMLEPSPEIEKEWRQELDRLTKMFGGKAGEDMTKFPDIKFAGTIPIMLLVSMRNS
ncbi:hypothetical protein AAG570_004936 [Ranatra chinensis]|uniref:ATP synthase-coupling factor 6, mitochondrial n=1 Tax=Ranatra chinensis TaxID=642074 RepID=A0ABD0YBR7_9HEMI